MHQIPAFRLGGRVFSQVADFSQRNVVPSEHPANTQRAQKPLQLRLDGGEDGLHAGLRRAGDDVGEDDADSLRGLEGDGFGVEGHEGADDGKFGISDASRTRRTGRDVDVGDVPFADAQAEGAGFDVVGVGEDGDFAQLGAQGFGGEGDVVEEVDEGVVGLGDAVDDGVDERGVVGSAQAEQRGHRGFAEGVEVVEDGVFDVGGFGGGVEVDVGVTEQREAAGEMFDVALGQLVGH